MKKLEQIRQESKEIKDKIDDTEERLRQLKNQEKNILKQDIVKRRKERTHRLITVSYTHLTLPTNREV